MPYLKWFPIVEYSTFIGLFGGNVPSDGLLYNRPMQLVQASDTGSLRWKIMFKWKLLYGYLIFLSSDTSHSKRRKCICALSLICLTAFRLLSLPPRPAPGPPPLPIILARDARSGIPAPPIPGNPPPPPS